MSYSARYPIFKPQSRPPPTTVLQLQTPALLGHPHEQALPQETEPFWHQHPEIAYPDAHYYPDFDLYTECPVYCIYSSNMDFAQVVIGSKSRYGRSTSNEAHTRPKRPRESVQVYLQDQFVGEISLGVLTRFSKLAKATFPKPALSAQPQVEPEKVGEGTKAKTETAQNNIASTSSNNKDWAEMAEQSDADRTVKSQNVEAVTAAKAEPQPQQSSSNEPLTPKELTIGVPSAWVQPNLSIAKHILTWMEQNKRTRNDEPLLPITPVPLAKLTLKTLVDTFTGVLAYDLSPFPRELRHEILTRLTQQPTKVEQIRYLYEHLPVDEPILNRMVTSFFEHSDASNYKQEEIDAIYEYIHEEVDDAGELERHFDRVKRSRARNQRRMNAMEKLREGFEDFAGPMTEALMADDDKAPAQVAHKTGSDEHKAPVPQTAPKPEGEERRRRNRREKKQQAQANAKAAAAKEKAA